MGAIEEKKWCDWVRLGADLERLSAACEKVGNGFPSKVVENYFGVFCRHAVGGQVGLSPAEAPGVLQLIGPLIHGGNVTQICRCAS